MDSAQTLPTSLRRIKQLKLDELSEERVLAYFNNVWSVYGTIMGSLASDEAYYLFPNALRRPLIFYLGHTACFYVNKMIAAGLCTEEERVNAHFEDIFAVGVDEMSWDDMTDNHFVWPPTKEVWEYRTQVGELVRSKIRSLDWSVPVSWDVPRHWSILMGIEHENIHLETSSVLIREMSLEHTKAPEGWVNAPSFGMPPANKFVKISGRRVRYGKPRDTNLSPTYGWDCEFGSEEEDIGDFEVTQFKVSNAEWLLFINDKGYERQELWTEEGWAWRTYTKASHPHFWVPIDASKFRYRAMYEEIEMPWDWPVEVNHLEAVAYCNWKGSGYRLIAEGEWRLLTGIEDSHAADTDQRDPGTGSETTELNTGYNFDLLFGSASPVNFFPPTSDGVYDVFGNVWELSCTKFRGLPGFQCNPLYMDFSTPCFDGKHDMLLGGSFISTGNETSIHGRYAFRRHFFQHAGFRVVRPIEKENVYETKTSLDQYIHFHYGQPKDVMPYDFGPITALDFPKRCAELCMKHSPDDVEAALDIGCAVGRSTFELARVARYVKGIDYSHSFANFGNSLRENGKMTYEYTAEGDLMKRGDAEVDPAIDRSRVEFEQGDAHCLPTDRAYDIVLGANLIDRLHTPAQFVRSVHQLVKSGGILVLTSPYTWLEEFTPKANWLGGFRDEQGNDVTTFGTLQKLLSAHFDLVEHVPLPFLIYEHQRKFQWSVAHGTVWKRK